MPPCVLCSSCPLATKGPRAACMNEVFISIVTPPVLGATLLAAWASVTSSSAISAPPWVTPNEFRCSGRGV
ncbi:hypothetical protein D3C86_1953120 [compost metagenome]